MEEDYAKDIKEVLDEAKEIKEKFNLESIDTAILILIRQDLETIRFHNSN